MNYHKQYGLLIKKSLQRTNLKGYKEKHHIKPECMGGCNKLVNKVKLTAREHYMAHWFLVKMYPKHHGLVLGLHMMTNTRKNQRQLNLSTRDYERVRILQSKNMTELWKDEEHRKKIKKYWDNPQNKNKVLVHWKKYWDNPQNKKKISENKKKYFKTDKGKKQAKEHSEKQTELWKDEEYRNNQLETHIEYFKTDKGKKQAKEHSEKLIEFYNNPEKRKKQSNNQKEYLKTDKGKEQLKKHSKKMTEHMNRPEERKKNSERRNKFLKTKKGKKYLKQKSITMSTKPFTIDGVYYLNLRIAVETLKIPKTTLGRRLNSPNFPEYKYI